MPPAQLHLISPEQILEFVRAAPLHDALTDIAGLADAEFTVEAPREPLPPGTPGAPGSPGLPIRYAGRPLGTMHRRGNGDSPSLDQAARAMTCLLEHVLDREMAVADLAGAMMISYEELNLLYSLLPKIASNVYPAEIGEVLVAETARTLSCQRVSLLVFDESGRNLKVLASHGLPPHARDVTIPIASSIAGRALTADDLLIVDDIATRPDLAAISQGRYESASFAVVRVPLRARGQAVGVLTATERTHADEFTARDCKLLDGLSAMGASALMNCRLHTAVANQMMCTIKALASAVDAKDQYTHDHSARVAQLCVATARELGITDAGTCREVELAGLLHDIGKIGIPDDILSKSQPLTSREYTVVKTHTDIGARIVENVPGLEPVAEGIRHHHERYDGLGYPSGLVGDAIPLTARLIAVADVYDSLTSNRPYRQATGVEHALQEIAKSRGTQMDPTIIDALTAVVTRE
ncbi:MAG: HD domain-containing protein [Phycisphaerales bacterium]|nr:MAG: HD domain-containing protein [Phycisphaerales bacterium]